MPNPLPDHRFKDLFTYAEWGIAIGSADGTTLEFVNPAYARMHGYTDTELIGQPIKTVYPAEIRDEIPRNIELNHAAGHRRFETVHQHRDGHTFPVLVDVTTVRNADDEVEYRIVNVQDISERKRTEQALQESQEFFRTVFEAAAVGMAIADEDGRYVRVNQAMVDFVGYSEAELLAMRYQDITHPDDIERNVAARTQLLAGGLEKIQMEKRYVRKDGREVWALMVATAVPACDGKPKYSIGQMLDIDALKRSEQHLKDSKSRLAEAQRIGEIGDYRWALDQTVIEFSAEAHRLLRGVSQATTLNLGETFQCIHDDDQRLIEQTLSSLAAGANPEPVTLRIPQADGTLRFLQARNELELDAAGHPWRVRGTVQDITRRHETENRLNQSRQQLRQMAAHHQTQLEEERKHIAREIHDELGQQLTALKMQVSLLKLRHADQADIVRSADAMSALLNHTVGVVRDISSALRPAAIDLGLRPALEWLAADFSARYGIACNFEADETPVPLNDQHTTAAFRIAQESLTNVARHARASDVRIILRHTDSTLTLEIVDDGCGMAATDESEYQGYGLLGMRERALSAGGTLEVGSAPGQGVRIELHLPLDTEPMP